MPLRFKFDSVIIVNTHSPLYVHVFFINCIILGDLSSSSSIVKSGLRLVAGLPLRATILALPIWSYEKAKVFFCKN